MSLIVVCLLILRTYLLTVSYFGLILRISKKLGKYLLTLFYRLRELLKDIYEDVNGTILNILIIFQR